MKCVYVQYLALLAVSSLCLITAMPFFPRDYPREYYDQGDDIFSMLRERRGKMDNNFSLRDLTFCHVNADYFCICKDLFEVKYCTDQVTSYFPARRSRYFF